jgi:small subunit ribosomal protein S18
MRTFTATRVTTEDSDIYRPHLRIRRIRSDPDRSRVDAVMAQLNSRLGSLAARPSPTTPPTNGSMAGEGAAEEFSIQELQNLQQRFFHGDVYAPNDLTMEEWRTRRKRSKPVKDAFDLLKIDPLKQYKVSPVFTSEREIPRGGTGKKKSLQGTCTNMMQNFNLLGQYVTTMGRIMHSRDTGLRPVNQRKIAKAIRRAVGIGFLPSTHKHPEVISRQDINSGRAGRR